MVDVSPLHARLKCPFRVTFLYLSLILIWSNRLRKKLEQCKNNETEKLIQTFSLRELETIICYLFSVPRVNRQLQVSLHVGFNTAKVEEASTWKLVRWPIVAIALFPSFSSSPVRRRHRPIPITIDSWCPDSFSIFARSEIFQGCTLKEYLAFGGNDQTVNTYSYKPSQRGGSSWYLADTPEGYATFKQFQNGYDFCIP